MAALIRHLVWKTGQEIFTKNEARTFASAIKHGLKKKNTINSSKKTAQPQLTGGGQRIDSVAESLASRGYLRSYKSYTPPENVKEQIASICGSINIASDKSHRFTSLSEKSNFLITCSEQFKHDVPNSLLHEMSSIGDVITFYETPVDTTLPMDAMKTMELPENLHIQHNYVRFHPETDTMFGGKSAFPKSSTLVTGLKYRGKYKGHVAKRSWP